MRNLSFLKTLLLCSGLLFLSSACSQAPKSQPGDVDIETFQKLMDKKGAQLVDVRTAEEYGEAHIPEATNYDFYGDNFEQQLMTLDPGKPVLLYCRSGNRSGQALEMLKERGFKEVYNLEDGLLAWKKAGQPVE